LIMDLRKADIDITGAEESLRAAEQAIEERNFDDVDAILTDLDDTAKELMDELVAASRNLIGRAERKIHEARDAGLDVDKAVAHLDAAEAAFEEGRFEDRSRELTETKEMAARLSDGLEAAAKDLVSYVEREVAEVRSTGLDPGRAEVVLLNAREAIDDGRFVEAIEYKKVI